MLPWHNVAGRAASCLALYLTLSGCRHQLRPEFSECREQVQRRRPQIYSQQDSELIGLRAELEAAQQKIQELTNQLQEKDPRVVVHEAPVPTPVPRIVEKLIENYIEVPYDDIREKLCEDTAPFGDLPGLSSVYHTTNVIEKEVVKEVEVKRVIEKEKMVYVKTTEVKAGEALYNAKLERQRQRMKAKMLLLSCRALL